MFKRNKSVRSKTIKEKRRMRLTIQMKMVLIGVGVVAAFIALILTVILPGLQTSLMSEKRTEIKEYVQVANSLLYSTYQQEKYGTMTEAQTQALAEQQLSSMRWGDDDADFFFIINTTPTMVMHLLDPGMDGTDLSNYKDHNGELMFVDMVNATKQNGAGFVSFSWLYSNKQNDYQEKIAYVAQFTPWNWIVGTGIYTIDVRNQVAALRNKYMMYTGIAALVSLLFIFIISGIVAKNVKKASNVANKLAMGDADQAVNIKSSDETGDMGKSLGNVVAYLKEMSQSADKIASGDLTVSVIPKSEKDTLSKSFSTMIANIKTSLEEIRKQGDYLNKIPMPIMVIDKEQNVQFMNSTCAGTISSKPEDCVGKKCTSLFHTDVCDSGDCPVLRAMAQGAPCTMDTISDGSSGKTPLRITGAPVKDAEGNIVGCIEYVQDITKERIAVDRMTAVAAELVKASEELSCGRRQRGNDWLFLLLRRHR